MSNRIPSSPSPSSRPPGGGGGGSRPPTGKNPSPFANNPRSPASPGGLNPGRGGANPVPWGSPRQSIPVPNVGFGSGSGGGADNIGADELWDVPNTPRTPRTPNRAPVVRPAPTGGPRWSASPGLRAGAVGAVITLGMGLLGGQDLGTATAQATGSLVGGFIGGAIGSLGGPVGTAIGASIGSGLGASVGGALWASLVPSGPPNPSAPTTALIRPGGNVGTTDQWYIVIMDGYFVPFPAGDGSGGERIDLNNEVVRTRGPILGLRRTATGSPVSSLQYDLISEGGGKTTRVFLRAGSPLREEGFWIVSINREDNTPEVGPNPPPPGGGDPVPTPGPSPRPPGISPNPPLGLTPITNPSPSPAPLGTPPTTPNRSGAGASPSGAGNTGGGRGNGNGDGDPLFEVPWWAPLFAIPAGLGPRGSATPATTPRGGTGTGAGTGTGGGTGGGGGGGGGTPTVCRFTEDTISHAMLSQQNAKLTAMDAFMIATEAANTAKLNEINRKLGPEIPDGGISGRLGKVRQLVANTWDFLQVDRAISVLTLLATFHNAMMLSSSLSQTLFAAVTNVLEIMGLKDSEGDDIDAAEVVSKWTEAFFKRAFGAETVDDFKDAWKKWNRVYQSAANIVFALQSISSSLFEALEEVGKYIASIGNAMKKFGVVAERAYAWMNPNPDYRNRFFTGIERAQDMADAMENITGEVRSIQETAQDLGGESVKFRQEADSAVGALTNSEDAGKTASKSPTIPPSATQPQGEN